MANGLKLKGGEASTGPHKINPIHNVMTRQRARHEARQKEIEKLRNERGGFAERGGFYWPESMPRRIARAIARTRAKFLFRFKANVEAAQ